MINSNETKLYIAKVAEYENAESYDKAYASLNVERKKKIDSFRFKQSKLQSLAAGVLLNCALKDAGLNIDDIKLEYNEYGKPYIKNSDLYFNISHSGDYAICAISNSEVGCDIEKIDSAEDKLAKRFFCKEEYENIISQPTEEKRRDCFYRYWTLKESFIKATGYGLKLNLNSFTINLDNKISINQSLNDKEYTFFEIGTIDGYKCSVCVEGKCNSIKYIF